MPGAIRRAARRPLVAAAVVGLAACGLFTAPASAKTRVVQMGGNVSCASLDPSFGELKLDRAPEVGDVLSNSELTVEVVSVKQKADGDTVGFAYRSLAGTPAVLIVKGGSTRANVAWGPSDDVTFYAPAGKAISNVKFCSGNVVVAA